MRVRYGRITIGIFIVLWLCAPFIYAHPLSVSYGELTIEDDNIYFRFSIDERSVIKSLFLDKNESRQLEISEVKKGKREIVRWMTSSLTFTAGENPIRLSHTEVKLEKRGDNQMVTAAFESTIPEGAVSLTITDRFYHQTDDQPSGYTHFLTVRHHDRTNEVILKGAEREHSVSLASHHTTAGQLPSWLKFFIFGMEHILTGYDHLLFLLALLLYPQKLTDYVKIVTAFTVAHSITLTLGYLEIVTLPSRLVETCIALSIVYVALENLSGKKHATRWAVAFLFGLVHGLGFAGLLAEMNIPKERLLLSLASFNLGIEAVQIALVALAVVIMKRVQTLPVYDKSMRMASILLLLAGSFWTIERLLQ